MLNTVKIVIHILMIGFTWLSVIYHDMHRKTAGGRMYSETELYNRKYRMLSAATYIYEFAMYVIHNTYGIRKYIVFEQRWFVQERFC